MTKLLDEEVIRKELETKTKEEIIDAIMREYRVTKNTMENEEDEKLKRILIIQMSEILSIINWII